jgi:hypothetical protein
MAIVFLDKIGSLHSVFEKISAKIPGLNNLCWSLFQIKVVGTSVYSSVIS